MIIKATPVDFFLLNVMFLLLIFLQSRKKCLSLHRFSEELEFAWKF